MSDYLSISVFVVCLCLSASDCLFASACLSQSLWSASVCMSACLSLSLWSRYLSPLLAVWPVTSHPITFFYCGSPSRVYCSIEEWEGGGSSGFLTIVPDCWDDTFKRKGFCPLQSTVNKHCFEALKEGGGRWGRGENDLGVMKKCCGQ